MPIDDLIGDLAGFDAAAIDALGPDDVAALAGRALDPADPTGPAPCRSWRWWTRPAHWRRRRRSSLRVSAPP